MRTSVLAAGLALVLSVAAAQTSAPNLEAASGRTADVQLDLQSPASPAPVDVHFGQKIPMRDGVALNATIYRPRGQAEPLPVAVTMTPYISDTYHERGMYFAGHGFVYAIVDVRGRGSSEGRFHPFANDAKDGNDVVEWLARQPWSDGHVSTWGGSYAGTNQWLTLTQFPEHLSTIVPAAAAHMGIDFPYIGGRGIVSPYWAQWITYTSGRTGNLNLFGDGSYWGDKSRQMFENHVPFARFDSLVGNPSEHFQRIVDHPSVDRYWKSMIPTPEHYGRIDFPILTITGYYDGDQPGAMEYYWRHRQHAPESFQDHYLVFGPWDHAGTRTPAKTCCGGLEFGDAALVDLNALHAEWYAWANGSGPKPGFLEKRVAYYAVGAEEWRYVDRIEEIGPDRRRYYLDSDGGGARSLAEAGRLVKEPTRSAPDRYAYDPLDTRAAGTELDQDGIVELLRGGLFYESAPLEEDIVIAGKMRFEASVAIDVPDTDFQVWVSEVSGDGESRMIGSAGLRARYRDSLEEPTLVEPGTVYRYVLDGFYFTYEPVARGSRLRLTLASPNWPGIQKNFNGGGDASRESAADARTAHVTVYHDPDRPSFVEIPLARR